MKRQRKSGGPDLKNVDIFGQPVSLRYDGETNFRTRIGGAFSLLLAILFLWFVV